MDPYSGSNSLWAGWLAFQPTKMAFMGNIPSGYPASGFALQLCFYHDGKWLYQRIPILMARTYRRRVEFTEDVCISEQPILYYNLRWASAGQYRIKENAFSTEWTRGNGGTYQMRQVMIGPTQQQSFDYSRMVFMYNQEALSDIPSYTIQSQCIDPFSDTSVTITLNVPQYFKNRNTQPYIDCSGVECIPIPDQRIHLNGIGAYAILRHGSDEYTESQFTYALAKNYEMTLKYPSSFIRLDGTNRKIYINPLSESSALAGARAATDALWEQSYEVYYMVSDPISFEKRYNFKVTLYNNRPSITQNILDVDIHVKEELNLNIGSGFYSDIDGLLNPLTITHQIESSCDKSWIKF